MPMVGVRTQRDALALAVSVVALAAAPTIAGCDFGGIDQTGADSSPDRAAPTVTRPTTSTNSSTIDSSASRPETLHGPEIVFVGSAGATYAVNPDGSGTTMIRADYATVSPDATKMIYDQRSRGLDDLYVANLDGSGERRLTHSKAEEFGAIWSPDRSRIAFLIQRPTIDSVEGNLYVISARGASPPVLPHMSM